MAARPAEPMSKSLALHVYNRAVRAAGVKRKGGLHSLRHYVERLTMWSSDQYYSENGAAIAA
jgi:hypothetical protein